MPLNWAANAGQDRTGGWGPASAFPTVTGAYWNPVSVDGRFGDAATLTMLTAPGLSERYVSIWIDMPNPGAAKSGDQLRWTTNTNLDQVHGQALEVGRGERVRAPPPALKSRSRPGTTLAIVDTRRGSGGLGAAKTEFASLSLLSASDSTYDGGYAGVAAAGKTSVVRLPSKPAHCSVPAAAGAPVLDNLEREEVPLTTGKWSKTSWASAIGGGLDGGLPRLWLERRASPGPTWNPWFPFRRLGGRHGSRFGQGRQRCRSGRPVPGRSG